MKKIRVGIVGTGWGQLQVEAFHRVREVEIVALCDVDAARLEDVAKRYKIAQTFTDYRELLAREDVELVSVATPPDSHYSITRAAIDAGKHVVCEKPLALDTNDACDLLARATKRGIIHAVDYEMRYLPAVAYAKELIDEEYLGQLWRVDVTMTLENPWGREHGNWAADDARGGGILWELGSHFIDILRWWFGDVSAVLAERRTNFPTPTQPSPVGNRGGQADDAFWCVLRFARGGEALLNFVSGARHDPGWTIGAYGQSGSLIVQGGGLLGKRDIDREMALLPIPKRLELGDNPRDPLLWSMVKLFERVVEKIRGAYDVSSFPTFNDGVQGARIVNAIRRASEAHGWIRVEE